MAFRHFFARLLAPMSELDQTSGLEGLPLAARCPICSEHQRFVKAAMHLATATPPLCSLSF